MPDNQVITVRATDQTPLGLRHLDGRTYPIRSGVGYPALGERSTLFGIPGIMREGYVWEITSDTPPPRVSGAQLGDLLKVLIEIRDLLKKALR